MCFDFHGLTHCFDILGLPVKIFINEKSHVTASAKYQNSSSSVVVVLSFIMIFLCLVARPRDLEDKTSDCNRLRSYQSNCILKL